MWVKFTMPVVIMIILGVFVMPVVVMIILGVFFLAVVVMIILGVVIVVIMLVKHSALSESNFFQSMRVKQIH